MIRFLINIPEDFRSDLRSFAKSRGQTLNGLIRQILWDWLNKQDKGV